MRRFFGRSSHLERGRAWLASGGRSITVVGPPGIGKTTFAAELTRHAAEPVYFCHLQSARAGEDVVRLLAEALRVETTGARTQADLEERLASAVLGRGPVLAVLDNFEHLVSHAAVVDRCLSRAPELRFVVTSRTRLNLEEEQLLELPPLSTSSAALGRPSEAAQLFLHAAARVRDESTLAEERLAEVDAIVVRLDGVPLAIELTASRMDTSSAAQLRRELESSGVLESAVSRGAPAGQYTALRDAIATSWSELSSDERSALGQLAACRGGFTADVAAELIQGATDLCQPKSEEVLSALRRKSLVSFDERSPSERLRLRLLESIREFAADQQDDAQVAECRERHARVFVERLGDWATSANDLLGGYSLDAAGRRSELILREELDNYVAIIEHGLEVGRATRVLEVLTSLDFLLCRAPMLQRYGDWISSALGQSGESGGLEALAYFCRSRVWRIVGAPQRAAEDLERAAELARDVEDRALEGRSTALLGLVAVYRQRYDDALALTQRAERLLGDAGDRYFRGFAIAFSGLACLQQGDASRGAQRLSEGATILRRHGDSRGAAATEGYLAEALAEQGRQAEAERMFESVLATLRTTGDRQYIGIHALGLGEVRLAHGDAVAADEAFREAEANLRHAGDEWHLLLARAGLAWVAASRDDLRRARKFEEQACVPASPLADEAAAPILALLRIRLQLLEQPRATLSEVRTRLGAIQPTTSRLRRLMALVQAALEAGMNPEDAGATPLVVDDGFAWVQPPGERKAVELPRGSASRRIVRRLVEARQNTPGKALDAETLIATGWPDERAQPESLANRLYATISRLRRHGLQSVLLRSDEGYFLDPNVVLARARGRPDSI